MSANVIPPLTITGANLTSTTVAEPHSTETVYSGAAVYKAGDRRISTTTHRVYESLEGTAATVTMTIATPCVVSWANHELAAGTPIAFTTTGALPTGLVAGTVYYVLGPLAGTFNLAATVGGAAIDTSGSQSGVHTATANPNIGRALTDEAWWADVGPTNKWAMFDLYRNTATTDTSPLTTVITPGERVDAIGLVGLDASRVNVSVDIPGFSRTNLLTYSEQFNHPNWLTVAGGTGAGPVVTANDAIAPNGTMTADKVVLDLGGGTTVLDGSYFYQGGTVSTGVNYTGSFYIKAADASQVGRQLAFRHVAASSWTVITLTADYQRVSVTELSGFTSLVFVIGLRGDFGLSNSVAFHIWGAQLEVGGAPTSYIPTTSAPVASTLHQVYSTYQNLTTREVGGWYDYFFAPFVVQPSLVLFDLPPLIGALVTVTLTRTGGEVSLGGMVLGQAEYLGEAQLQAVSDALNFSEITRDAISGEAVLVPRRNVPKASMEIWTPKTNVNRVRQIRDDLNAVPALWCGLPDSAHPYFEAVLILGIYTRLTIGLDQAEEAKIQLELEEI